MIFFLRHQATYNNKFGFISGQADSPILRESVYIENNNVLKIIDAVYSSPSQRCLDTLQLIPQLDLSPTIDVRLLERKMGVFENCERKNLYRKFPSFFRNINGQVYFKFELTPPKGESYSEFAQRISSFCSEVISQNLNRNILICSHNQAMKMMYCVLKGIKPSDEIWNKINFPNGKIVAYT